MKKFKYALNGFKYYIKDNSILIQLILGVFVFGNSLFFKLELADFLIILSLIFMVILFEVLNSIIEQLCDLYSKEYDLRIKKIKDLSASMVLIVCLLALFIGIIIFSRYI